MSHDEAAGGPSAGLRDAASESWSRRASAGRRLAASAGREDVDPVIDRLLLDPHDTAVTQETAQALLERQDLVGLRAVLAALSRAEAWWTADQLDGEVCDHLGRLIADRRQDQLVQRLRTLASEDDAGVRAEALRLLGEA